MENWLAAKPLSGQTKNHVLSCFRIILREAKRAKLIPSNPLADAERFGVRPKRAAVFTEEHIRTLFPTDLLTVWGNLKDSAFFMVVASCGIRPSEARALLWSDYIDGAALFIGKAARDFESEAKQTKSGEKRVVPVPKRTAKYLDLWHNETPAKAKDDLVFFGSFPGKLINRRYVNVLFDTAP
jgi:integrase